MCISYISSSPDSESSLPLFLLYCSLGPVSCCCSGLVLVSSFQLVDSLPFSPSLVFLSCPQSCSRPEPLCWPAPIPRPSAKRSWTTSTRYAMNQCVLCGSCWTRLLSLFVYQSWSTFEGARSKYLGVWNLNFECTYASYRNTPNTSNTSVTTCTTIAHPVSMPSPSHSAWMNSFWPGFVHLCLPFRVYKYSRFYVVTKRM